MKVVEVNVYTFISCKGKTGSGSLPSSPYPTLNRVNCKILSYKNENETKNSPVQLVCYCFE